MYTLARGSRDLQSRIIRGADWIIIGIGLIGFIAAVLALVFPFQVESVITWILLKCSGGLPSAVGQ